MRWLRQLWSGTSGEADGSMKIVLSGLAVLMLAGGFVLAAFGNTASAGITYGAAVFCLIFAFLSRFKRFKGLGIEAELWEQKQEEAAALIDRLKKEMERIETEMQKIETARVAMLDQLKPRDLTAEQMDKFASTVRGKVREVAVFSLSDAETWLFAQALVAALQRGGVTAHLMPPQLGFLAGAGAGTNVLTVYEHPPAGDDGPGAALFKACCDVYASGFHTPSEASPDIPSPALFVGMKQPPFMTTPEWMKLKHPGFSAPTPLWAAKPATSDTAPPSPKK
jgi:hypothetical protein